MLFCDSGGSGLIFLEEGSVDILFVGFSFVVSVEV